MNTVMGDLLRQVSFFGRLDAAMLEQIAGRARRRRFGAHEALFHEGDPGQTLYVIVSGSVAIQKTSAAGQTIHVAERGAGEHFGELALIDGRPRMADAVTVTACDLLMLDREEFVHCIETSPPIALAVMASLAERLREAADGLEERRSLDVLGRLAQTLLALAEGQGTPPEPSGALRLELALSRQELADRVGTTRESVSRALGRLGQLGAVRVEGRSRFFLDPAKLRRYCGR
ncbi:MAG: Crp/Fnr family transcriptional regulator [Armatimonadota bacterium]|nr:Crp/Fnr family transcriptional regulator [Armatimonadota bacterium]